jgi:hypothetical protein
VRNKRASSSGYKSHNKSVLGGVVLVLVLGDQGSAGMVVSLVLASSSELNLEALVVSIVLDNLEERLGVRNLTTFLHTIFLGLDGTTNQRAIFLTRVFCATFCLTIFRRFSGGERHD